MTDGLAALKEGVELMQSEEVVELRKRLNVVANKNLGDSDPGRFVRHYNESVILDSLTELLKGLPATAKSFVGEFILYAAGLPRSPWETLSYYTRAIDTAADLVVSTGYDAEDLISKMLAENSSRTIFALALINAIAARTKVPDLGKIESQLCQVLSVLNSSDKRDEILGAALRLAELFKKRPLKLFTAFRQHLNVNPQSAGEAQEALLLQLAPWTPDGEVSAIEDLCFKFFEHASAEIRSKKEGGLELVHPPLVHFAPLTDRSIRSHKRFEQLLTDKSFKLRKIAYHSFDFLPLTVAEEFLHRIVTKEPKASLVHQALSALPTIYSNDCVRGLAQLERFSSGPLKVKIAKIREAIAQASEGLERIRSTPADD